MITLNGYLISESKARKEEGLKEVLQVFFSLEIIEWKFWQEVVSLKTLLLSRLGNAELKHAWNQSNWKMPFQAADLLTTQ